MTTIRVNGVEIEAEAVAREVQLHPAASLEEARQAAAQALVVRELLLQEAHRLALAPTSADDEDDEAEEDREEDVDDALIRTLLEREVSVSESGEERCRRHYQQNAGSYCTPKLYEASHILFAAPPDDPNGRESARRAALDALAALQKNPRGFTDLAREHSACPSGAEGGGLGQFTADQMVLEFVATVSNTPPFTIVAAKLKLKPGMGDIYQKRHDAIWPELSKAIRDAGISDFSIFLDEETGTLFSVQKVAATNSTAELRKSEIMHKWWNHMADLMEVNPDHSPVRVPLKPVFHQD